MIANERQYRITKAWADRFADALARAREHTEHLHPRIRQAMQEGIESQLTELREQLADYEALRQGRVAVLELDSLDQLPDALIRARTAAGLTQKQLAARLGLKEQQIQRYEATRYAGATLRRIQAVADALGVQIHERVLLPTAR
jgi:ribosome-binding protein aMBF1 (putative translation factor)